MIDDTMTCISFMEKNSLWQVTMCKVLNESLE